MRVIVVSFTVFLQMKIRSFVGHCSEHPGKRLSEGALGGFIGHQVHEGGDGHFKVF